MNKFDLHNVVLVSQLKADDKNLLIELINRTDYERHGNWDCWPTVQRLAMVRGMKNERHFKGVSTYLPGLVETRKNGRRNIYTLNVKEIMALPSFETIIKHTPAMEADTPAVEGVNTPAVAANTPAVAGANSTKNTTVDNTKNTTVACGEEHAGAHSLSSSNIKDKDLPDDSLIGSTTPAVAIGEPIKDTPATAGVSEDDYYEWNGRKVLKAGAGDPFDGVDAAAPVEPEVKTPCPHCDTYLDKSGLCWNMGCTG